MINNITPKAAKHPYRHSRQAGIGSGWFPALVREAFSDRNDARRFANLMVTRFDLPRPCTLGEDPSEMDCSSRACERRSRGVYALRISLASTEEMSLFTRRARSFTNRLTFAAAESREDAPDPAGTCKLMDE